jgi:hypothetical protein
MYERVESEYYTAKRKAAARLGVNPKHAPQQLPSNREIRDEIQTLARMYEGDARDRDLADMRVAALRMMRNLEVFDPHLIGSVATGHVRQGSDIDIHVFADGPSALTDILDRQGLPYTVERKRIIKHNEERHFTHIHVRDRFTFELTLYPRDKQNYRFKSSITGKAIERWSVAQLEELIRREHPNTDIADADDVEIDRFLLWAALLAPLENVKQDPRWHPEGDALYHALQAFEIARREFPYDQEMITAALLHDVGKAIDRADHVAAGCEALAGTLTPREEYLIAQHMEGQAYRARTLGARRRRTLAEEEWFDDLLTLCDIDERARRRGVDVCTIDEAIAFLRDANDRAG